MFDLITGKEPHIPGGGTGPVLVSTALHTLALGAIIAIPLLFVSNVLPEVPTMMAFVASAPVPPPPPPPPPAPAPPATKRTVPQNTPQTPAPNPAAAPIEAPAEVTPEPAAPAAVDAGVPGGVEGGIPEGVVGGIVGGIGDAPPPPPPPPPPPSGPVRIGGQVQPPKLIRRVEPVYPLMAANANIQGVVILEATVSAEGYVRDVRVLRSVPLLERAAIEAVRQWRYSPVVLNGTPVPFILTVVVSFTVPDGRSARSY